MSEVDWNSDTVIQLVQEYSQKPELWDSKHPMYRNPAAKYEAWTSLAQHFQCDISDVRKKLNSIFASHRREKAKVRAGQHSTWFLYPYMKFWPTHVDNSIETSRQVSKDEEYEEPCQDQTPEQSSMDDSSEDEPLQTVQIKQEPSEKPKKRPIHRTQKARLRLRKVPKDHRSLDSKLIEALKLLKKSDHTKKKDECDSFGEYIATSLRKHDERTQSMIKQAINNILFEQEMKKYSTGQYTVLLTGVEENPLILGEQESDH